jgi:hypothetical protein
MVLGIEIDDKGTIEISPSIVKSDIANYFHELLYDFQKGRVYIKDIEDF